MDAHWTVRVDCLEGCIHFLFCLAWDTWDAAAMGHHLFKSRETAVKRGWMRTEDRLVLKPEREVGEEWQQGNKLIPALQTVMDSAPSTPE